ncbi:ArsR/SmtB family transcription factor [Oenococcus oeni]|uniref:ArsR/SmtB family transcription factor n=1 Tax=Oenococcus oeni TaxID=1247 RepID=UPI00050EE2DD|nr:ArsR family transcriptional regulator [Oenococcus oeni IOEB_C52]
MRHFSPLVMHFFIRIKEKYIECIRGNINDMQTADYSMMSEIIGNPQRLGMLVFLMDGRFHTVSEVTKATNLKSNTVSLYLSHFEKISWLDDYFQGRWHYYRLANSEVASLIEKILVLSPKKKITYFNLNEEEKLLHTGRSCYSHLAGQLGVQLLCSMKTLNWIRQDGSAFQLTDKGQSNLNNALEIKFSFQEQKSWDFILPCMDWSERQLHLKGIVGKKILGAMLDKEWLYRPNRTRALALTYKGKEKFGDFLQIRA